MKSRELRRKRASIARKGCFAACAAFALGMFACGGSPRQVASPPTPGPGWRYEVVSHDGARELSIAAHFPPGTSGELRPPSRAESFVRDVEAYDAAAGAWVSIAPSEGSWFVSACYSGCDVRYRFQLEAAARVLDDVDRAQVDHGVTVTSPSLWLLRPYGASPKTPVSFHVTTPPDTTFVTGVFADPGGVPGTYAATASDMELAPYSAFGPLRTHRIHQEGATLQIAIAPGRLAMKDEDIDRWVAASARAVAAFYRRFPLPSVLLLVVPTAGDSVEHGRTLAGGGASVVLHLGEDMTAEGIVDDWVLTHELTHLAFPTLPRAYAWLEEGLATYVEPIARARVGVTSDDEVWRGLVLGLPKGTPREGDQGLDRTHTWGRTYWGGALYCLLADLEIRRQSNNQVGLEDALRGILDAGGNDAVRWDLRRTLEIGDRAVGGHVLRDLHARMGLAPVDVDLDGLFRQLGVSLRGKSVVLDEAAPLAAIRRAMTLKDSQRPALLSSIPSCADLMVRDLGPCVVHGRSPLGIGN